jgi:hypothetical protein
MQLMLRLDEFLYMQPYIYRNDLFLYSLSSAFMISIFHIINLKQKIIKPFPT